MKSNQKFKKYIGRFALACAAYVVTVVLYVLLLDQLQSTVWRYVVALLPIIPIGFAMYYQIMAVRSTDELHRRIYSEALTISALLTGFITFTYAFLEQAGFPKFSTFLFFPMMFIIWGMANLLLSRRYQ